MWTRKELKEKAKKVFYANYWKMVLVSLIVIVLSGGLGGSVGSSGGSTSDTTQDIISESEVDAELDENLSEFLEDEDLDNEDADDEDADVVMGDNLPSFAWIAGFAVGLLVVLLICMAIGFLLSAFLLNPLFVGTKRFFAKSIYENCQIREIAYAFDHAYMNVVKIMFFKDLYTMLWSLLFIVPGIIKSYEYRMIPYLVGENPELSKEEAFAMSKEMMKGEKWRAFVLDLSFIGWGILTLLTCGLLSIFYVAPYQNLTNAALYHKLCGRDLEQNYDIQDDIIVE